MKDAINKAIEGGFHNVKIFNRYLPASNIEKQIKEPGFIHEILLDPLFWQALGKAEEWDISLEHFICTNPQCKSTTDWLTKKFCQDCGWILTPEEKSTENWKKQMHSLLDHIIADGTVDEFFNKILTK